MEASEYFIKGCDKLDGFMDILNWYRHLYYRAKPDTEHGIMAKAIDDMFMKAIELDILGELCD